MKWTYKSTELSSAKKKSSPFRQDGLGSIPDGCDSAGDHGNCHDPCPSLLLDQRAAAFTYVKVLT